MEGDRKLSTPSDGLGTSGSAPRIRALHGRTSGPTRRSTKGQWTAEEDEILRKAVERFKGKNWKKIAECFKDRTDVQCLHRWQKVLNPELVKGPWSKEEDEIIIELVNKYGPKKWSTIAQHLPGRIGKQCRERWHNHLNPAINKEAWTQEEELALIRAHRIYGNRWAELSKFLPGRTDNAIKNHWNSSVKKKLDSYIASGLLDQFPFSHATNQNPSVPLAMARMQNTVDGGGSKGCTEPEEVSECSQESAKFGYSLSSSNNIAILVSNEADQFYLSEANIGAIEQNSSPASCSERYFASIEDATFSIPEIPSEEVYSPTFDERFSQDSGSLNPGDTQHSVQDRPHSSALESGHEASGFTTHCTSGNQEVVNMFQTSVGFDASTSNVVITSEKSDRLLITDDECCRLLFLESGTIGNFSCENPMRDSSIDGTVQCKDSSDIQIADSEKASGSQSSSGCPAFVPVRSILSAEDNMLLYGPEPIQYSCQTFCAEETLVDNYANPLSDDTDRRGLQDQSYPSKDYSKLIPVNSFNSGANVMQACPIMDDSKNLRPQHDPGPLCYEPPRFPSLDMPFFSCDLVQTGSDMQQEYSPLGIRQLMMSSMNSITPFRLWDSPTREDGPDAVLKSAAKTFTNTPSILKKRHRDLLSPLSERRIDKKLETDMANSLTENFSRLDVMFDENSTEKGFKLSPSATKENCKTLVPAKESPAHVSGGREGSTNQIASSNDNLKSNDLKGGASSHGSTKQGNVDTDTTAEEDKDSRQQAAGVLVEHNMNNLRMLSPEVRVKADRSFASSSWTPKSQHSKSLGRISGQIVGSESSLPCIVVRSPAVKTKNGETLSIIVSSGQDASTTAAPLENSANNGRNENYNILGGTPFRRSIESPSAWKSPWFLNSFVPGPRIDTEITIEDFGFLMSPADRSYDAISLMKQLSEHTAAAYADALEVLGNETPESLVKQRHLTKINSEKENSQLENCSHTASNISTERRTLDFSDCGTPVKGGENGKSSTALNLHSPSSYLLKSCR